MRGKILRGVLLTLLAVALIALVVKQLQLRALQAEETRLEQLVGSLDVRDPEQIHLALVETPEALHLLWRVHLPANTTWRLAHESAYGGSGWSQSGPREVRNELLRWRVVESRDSSTSHLLSGSSSATNSMNPKTDEFLRSNWDRLDVQVAGQNGTVVASVDQVIPLITIRVPDELLPTAREELGEYIGAQLKEQPLLKFELGSEAAFTARQAKLEEEKSGA